jgi:ABC-type phosphate/phosphonate transport system ATPase subunit
MAVDYMEVDVIHYVFLAMFGKLLIRVSLQGRMVEIFGKEASGKTTLALHVIKEAQKNGGLSFFYDTFSPPFFNVYASLCYNFALYS